MRGRLSPRRVRRRGTESEDCRPRPVHRMRRMRIELSLRRDSGEIGDRLRGCNSEEQDIGRRTDMRLLRRIERLIVLLIVQRHSNLKIG